MPKFEPFTKVVIALQVFGFIFAGLAGLGLVSCTFTTVQETFNLTYTDMAIILGAGQITQVLASFFAAKLERPWLPAEAICGVGCLVGMLGKLVYGGAQHFAMLVIGQLLAGLGNSFTFIYMPSMLGRLTDDPTRLSDGIGKSLLTSPFGLVASVAVCGGAHQHWRWLFIGFGSLTVIPAAMFLYLAWGYKHRVDPRREVPPAPSVKAVCKKLCASPYIVLAVFGLTFASFVGSAWAAFIAPYIERHMGQGKMVAAFVLAGTVPVVAASMFVGGKIAHVTKWPPHRLLAFIGAASMLTFLDTLIVLPANITILWLFVVVLVVAMFFLFMQMGPGIAVVAQMLPDHMVCAGQSLVNAMTRTIGATLAPFVLGIMIDNGVAMNMAFFIVSCVLPVATLFYLIAALLSVRDRREKAKRTVPDPVSPALSNASLTSAGAPFFSIVTDEGAPETMSPATPQSEGTSFFAAAAEQSIKSTPTTTATTTFGASFECSTPPESPGAAIAVNNRPCAETAADNPEADSAFETSAFPLTLERTLEPFSIPIEATPTFGSPNRPSSEPFCL